MDDAAKQQLRLGAAKEKRAQHLAALTKEYELCSCTYPLDKYRNTTGHGSECPAHAWLMEQRETREATQGGSFVRKWSKAIKDL